MTITVTIASARNAAIAPQKAAAWAEPRLNDLPGVSESGATAAPSVPATSLQKPAQGVIRRQNMPMMNVANSGALKNENSSWM